MIRFRQMFDGLRQQVDAMFDGFEKTFESFDAQFEDLDRQADQMDASSPAPAPGETVTTHREETRADGTRIVTTVTRTRTVHGVTRGERKT